MMGFFAGQTTEAEDELAAERAQAEANRLNPEYVKATHPGGAGFTTTADGKYRAADGTIYDTPDKAAFASRTPEELEAARKKAEEQETYRLAENASANTWLDRWTSKLVENIPLIFNLVSLGASAYATWGASAAASAATSAAELTAAEAAKAVAEGYMQNSAGTWVADLSSPVWAQAGTSAATAATSSGIQQVVVGGVSTGISSAAAVGIGGAIAGGLAQSAINTGVTDGIQRVEVSGQKPDAATGDTTVLPITPTGVDLPNVTPSIEQVTVTGQRPEVKPESDLPTVLPMPGFTGAIQQVTVTPDKVTKAQMNHRDGDFVGPMFPMIGDLLLKDKLLNDVMQKPNTTTPDDKTNWWDDISKLLPILSGLGGDKGKTSPSSSLINLPQSVGRASELSQQANGKANVQFGRTKSRYELRGKFKKTGIKL